MRVRDDPRNPDPHFAELYSRLPPPASLQPWLGWCRSARRPVLYLGVGAGRLAGPLFAAGVELLGVDAHPGMLERLRHRLPGLAVHQAFVEELDLESRFDLVIAPSNLLDTPAKLAGAARHAARGGRVGLELMNPHWLHSGASPGVIVKRLEPEVALEVEYQVGDDVWTQEVSVAELVWPEAIESYLEPAGLRLRWFGGEPGLGLEDSPTFYVLAERA
jgi:methyltransferase family protein